MEEAAAEDVAMVVVAEAVEVVEAGLAATTLLSVAIAAGKSTLKCARWPDCVQLHNFSLHFQG